ncbi:MAG: hypothetical protein ACRENF_08505, partial [Thermodesulfobacteriota bacterium]
ERVFSFGYKLTYADDTCVAHPARRSLEELYKKCVRVTSGQHELIKLKSPYPSVMLVKDLFMASLPPVTSAARIYSDGRPRTLNATKQKFKIILILLFVKCLRVWETVRLLLGGKSKG